MSAHDIRAPKGRLEEAADLAGETNVGVRNASDGLDRCEDIIKGAAPLPHEVGNGQGGTARDSLGAVQQDTATACFCFLSYNSRRQLAKISLPGVYNFS